MFCFVFIMCRTDWSWEGARNRGAYATAAAAGGAPQAQQEFVSRQRAAGWFEKIAGQGAWQKAAATGLSVGWGVWEGGVAGQGGGGGGDLLSDPTDGAFDACHPGALAYQRG